jgi:hypothetical protein
MASHVQGKPNVPGEKQVHTALKPAVLLDKAPAAGRNHATVAFMSACYSAYYRSGCNSAHVYNKLPGNRQQPDIW